MVETKSWLVDNDEESLIPIRIVSWCVRDQLRVRAEPGDEPERWGVEVEASGEMLAR